MGFKKTNDENGEISPFLYHKMTLSRKSHTFSRNHLKIYNVDVTFAAITFCYKCIDISLGLL